MRGRGVSATGTLSFSLPAPPLLLSSVDEVGLAEGEPKWEPSVHRRREVVRGTVVVVLVVVLVVGGVTCLVSV
jgi:hypothetical protein